jgi:hypothetical protein
MYLNIAKGCIIIDAIAFLFVGGKIFLDPYSVHSFQNLTQPTEYAFIRVFANFYLGLAFLCIVSLFKREWLMFAPFGLLVFTCCILFARIASVLIDGGASTQMPLIYEESFFVILALAAVKFERLSRN